MSAHVGGRPTTCEAVRAILTAEAPEAVPRWDAANDILRTELVENLALSCDILDGQTTNTLLLRCITIWMDKYLPASSRSRLRTGTPVANGGGGGSHATIGGPCADELQGRLPEGSSQGSPAARGSLQRRPASNGSACEGTSHGGEASSGRIGSAHRGFAGGRAGILRDARDRPTAPTGLTPSAELGGDGLSQVRARKVKGSSLVSRRVCVYWEADRAWYAGVIASYDRTSERALVLCIDAAEARTLDCLLGRCPVPRAPKSPSFDSLHAHRRRR